MYVIIAGGEQIDVDGSSGQTPFSRLPDRDFHGARQFLKPLAIELSLQFGGDVQEGRALGAFRGGAFKKRRNGNYAAVAPEALQSCKNIGLTVAEIRADANVDAHATVLRDEESNRMHDRRNVAPSERWLSLGAGLLMGAAAAHLLYRAATGYCRLYAALGIASMPAGDAHNPSAAVPYGAGVRVEETISIERPAPELYAFWRRLETLPQFMRHLDDVTVLTPTRSRWRVHAPAGRLLSWEAEIINDVPDELIGWRSLPGSAVDHAGSVHFDRRGSVTDVRVVLEYVPPAGYAGATVAKLLGDRPQAEIAEDLRRFKSIAERGEICAS